MRLNLVQVNIICQKILHGLKAVDLVELKANEVVVLKRMEELFVRDLRVEDDINREAQVLLDKYEAQMGNQVDRQKMFQMIKAQLVKEKGVVL